MDEDDDLDNQESSLKSSQPLLIDEGSANENMIAYEIEDPDEEVNVQFVDYEQVEYLEVDTGSEDIHTLKTENNKSEENNCDVCLNFLFKTEFGMNRHLFLKHQQGSSEFKLNKRKYLF